MHTVFFSKAATEITLAGLKQPFCFCSDKHYSACSNVSMPIDEYFVPENKLLCR